MQVGCLSNIARSWGRGHTSSGNFATPGKAGVSSAAVMRLVRAIFNGEDAARTTVVVVWAGHGPLNAAVPTRAVASSKVTASALNVITRLPVVRKSHPRDLTSP